VAKGRWKRRLGWALVAGITATILLAATWRAWVLDALRLGLEFRSVQVAKVTWEGTNALKFEHAEWKKDGFVARANSVVVLTPRAWKKALRSGDTNVTYLTVNGWRVILPENGGATRSMTNRFIAQKLQRLNEKLHRAEAKCPRAVILNGTLQTAKGEFNFGVIEWKGGELSGNFTWPQLNDPADFRLKIVDPAKLQLIVKQTGLEIGSRTTAEILADGARLAGYARWKTNRVDFDLTFAASDDTPRNAIVDSKGMALPGRLVAMPDVDTFNARLHFTITNGQFDFSMGAPESSETGTASEGTGQ
jgi:hypothetical protein